MVVKQYNCFIICVDLLRQMMVTFQGNVQAVFFVGQCTSQALQLLHFPSALFKAVNEVPMRHMVVVAFRVAAVSFAAAIVSVIL